MFNVNCCLEYTFLYTQFDLQSINIQTIWTPLDRALFMYAELTPTLETTKLHHNSQLSL